MKAATGSLRLFLVVVDTPTKLNREQKDLLKKPEDAAEGNHPKHFFDRFC